MVGKVSSYAISSLPGSLMGILVTNTPTTFQKSFGTYTITDYTEPGWIVELYVNYVLVSYVKADAKGYFSFDVPLVYGNSLVKLRFYGPWGEEHSREQIISIPFNFLPPRKLEYMFNAGVIDDYRNSKFTRAEFHYGINRRLTLGGGAEYLSSLPSNNVMPFVNFNLRLASSLLISGEYTYAVKLKGLISYRLLSKLLIELYYTKINNNQKAIISSYLEERKAVLSMPVRISSFSSLMRLTLYQIILPFSNTISGEFLISGSLFGISTNLTTYALFTNPVYPYVYTNLSLGFRLPAGFIITPQAQYIISQNRFLSAKISVEKKLFMNGILNVMYERSFVTNSNNLQAGIRYDFPFAQTNFSARYANNQGAILEYGRGSIVNQGKGGKIKVTSYSTVGRGGIIILPFLDLNRNGKREVNEPKVSGMNLHITGGRVERSNRDTTITISELEPYTKYFLELDRSSFSNISWRIPKVTISITVNPNQYRLVEIPVNVEGEVSGYVYKRTGKFENGQSRITVCFYRNGSVQVATTMTESDGYFNYLGLSPGSYTARIDPVQLEKIHMTSIPEEISFSVGRSIDGDIIEDLKFFISGIKKDTVSGDIESP